MMRYCKDLTKKIINSPKILKFLFGFFSYVHGKCYMALSVIAILQNKGVHPKHRILNYHKFFLDHVESSDTVLDIGCSHGNNAFDVAQKAKEVVGIDIEKKYIEVARKKFSKSNITYIIGDATTYKFDKKFDKVILASVLEHIDNRVDLLKKLHSLTDIVLFRVPLITREWLPVYKKEQGIDYRLDKTHFTEYTLEQAKEELDQSGWKFREYSIQFGEIWGVLCPKD